MSDPSGDASLRSRRVAAAEESRGTSDEAVYSAIERELSTLGASGDLLDFGAGTGQFTARLKNSAKYRSVTGADLFPRGATLPADIRWVQGDLNDPLPLPDAGFDVVVAAEVIEHLENPRAMCRESWRSIVAFVVRGHHVAFGESCYPAHITPLVRQDLDHVLAEAGFVDRAFAFSDLGGVPGLPARSWQTLLGGRAKGLRFSDNIVVMARKPAR
jgi:SAM-dependent methyltransferase